MNMDAIGSAVLMIYDELKDDKKSKKLIKKIDEAEGDATLKEGIREGVERLRELKKNAIADAIVEKTIGFAFDKKGR